MRRPATSSSTSTRFGSLAALILFLAFGASGAMAAVLTVTDITDTRNCDFSGCSVTFNNHVCNSDPINGYSIVVGSYFGYSGSISTCAGRWDSQDSWFLAAGQCAWIPTAGPGYVGPKISSTGCVTVTTNPDIYCHETTSSLTKTLCN
jgi:hypothetical protein